MDMRVNGNHRLAEGKGQHDVSAFSADAGKRHQPLSITWHDLAMLFDERLAKALQITRLRIVEPSWLDRSRDHLVIERKNAGRRVRKRTTRFSLSLYCCPGFVRKGDRRRGRERRRDHPSLWASLGRVVMPSSGVRTAHRSR